MNKIKLNDRILKIENYKPSSSFRYKFITKDVRIIAYDITSLAFEAISAHNLGLIEGKILSESFLSALMISEMLKNDNDAITWELECSGPIGGVSIECKKNGNIRGFVHNNPVDVGNLVIKNFSDFIGAGFISCTKHIEGFTQNQKSSIMIEKGKMPYDTAIYFKESEQVNTDIAMWVKVKDDKIESIEGLMVQALPQADIKNLERIENIVTSINNPFLKDNYNITNFVDFTFSDFKPKFLSKEKLKFYCPCSKEHYENIINNMQNTQDIFKGEDYIDVTCSMCSSCYRIERGK